MAARRPRPHLVVRHPHRALARRRREWAGVLALVAVLGPGLLAGLSDDDPAALLAAAVVPLSTAYSISEAFERRADLNDSFAEAPLFYGAYAGSVLVAVTLVLIPGAPLIAILFLSQALNAVLLLAILPFLRSLARDPEVMGDYRIGRGESMLTAAIIGLVAVSVVTLGVVTVT